MSHLLDFTSLPQTDRGSQSVLTFLQPGYFCRLTTMSHYPKWTITSSLQNANKSHWELHLSLVAALLSHFDCKLRTTKSHAWRAKHTPLVSVPHTISVLVPGHVHPSPLPWEGAMQAEESTGAAVPIICPRGKSREHAIASPTITPA